MGNIEPVTFRQLEAIQKPVCPTANELFDEVSRDFSCKWVVLDDDPTGIQTVNGISVYTDWSEESIEKGFEEQKNLFFILTNSRGMTENETVRIHAEIAERVLKVSMRTGKKYQIISRGDSTLRGHYPVETEVLRRVTEANSNVKFDGEVICPFFPQGGRFTVNNVHYVCMDGVMIPAGDTEFAKDKTFGYQNSHLGKWIEEKTGGAYKAEDQIYLSIDELRSGDVERIAEKLCRSENFMKIIVNAMAYEDIYVFAAALILAEKKGKNFLFRTAAVIPEVLGKIRRRSLLEGREMLDPDNKNGGLILVGSHVKKTTDQLNELLTLDNICEVPFHSSLVLDDGKFLDEQSRVQRKIEETLSDGKNVVVYTERKLMVPASEDPEDALRLSVRISDAVTGFVKNLKVRPSFIIAKGGITSSDIGVKGLGVKRADVAGQILPGIPVWKLGADSKFPGLPYIIFPGNVGEVDSLKQACLKLTRQG